MTKILPVFIHQQPGHLEPPPLFVSRLLPADHEQRGVALVVFSLGVGALGQQGPDSPVVVPERGEMQRRVSLLVPGLYAGAGRQERLCQGPPTTQAEGKAERGLKLKKKSFRIRT